MEKKQLILKQDDSTIIKTIYKQYNPNLKNTNNHFYEVGQLTDKLTGKNSQEYARSEYL